MKLFASDLDGTLLNRKHRADWIINHGLQIIKETGNVFTVSTGRNLSLFRTAKLDKSYVICMNGSCILDPDEKILIRHPLNKEVLHFLLFDTPFQFEYQTIDGIYTTKDAESFKQIYMANQMLRNRDIKEDMVKNLAAYSFESDPYWILDQEIYKVNFHFTDPSMGPLMDQLAKDHADKIVNAPSVPSLAEITGAGITKGNAVKELAKILDIHDQDIYVYGDGINDVSMLSSFEHSYCPAESTKEAKAAAHYELGPFEEYSVIRHMVDVCTNMQ